MKRERWHSPDGTELSVSCSEGTCLGELILPGRGRLEIFVEILLQPCSESGQPQGSAITICRERVPVMPLAHRECRSGRFWLPEGLRGKDLNRCYFRILQDARWD